MITLLFHRHFHVFFFTVVLSFNIFTNTSLGTQYAGSGSMEFIRKSLQSNTLHQPLLQLPVNLCQFHPDKPLATGGHCPFSCPVCYPKHVFFHKEAVQEPSDQARDVGPMEDCLNALGDAVQDLKDSIVKMAHIKDDKNFLFLMSNIQTRFSAAFANEDSCTDGFSENAIVSKVKMAVTRKIKSIVQLTSNALALINNYASDHVQGRRVL